MEPHLIELITLAAAGFVSSAVSAVVGFGGGAILMAVVLMFMPPGLAIPFHGLVQLVANSSRVVMQRRWIAWSIALPFVLFLFPGAILGRVLFEGLSERTIFVLIGLFVLATLYSREIPFFRGRECPRWFFLPLGFGVGVLGSTVGVVGMIFAPFMDRRDLTKEGINGTLAAMAGSVHLMKIAAFGIFGFDITAHLPALAAMVPAVILGSIFGRAVLVRFSEAAFRALFKATLVALSIKLILWDGVLQPMWF